MRFFQRFCVNFDGPVFIGYSVPIHTHKQRIRHRTVTLNATLTESLQ